MSADDGAGRREVAYRLLAAEFEDADFSYSESDEERAPNYVVTPTGARVNRLFVVGVLTEVEQAGEDILRARVVDPTGAFVVYAGQYQPDAQAFFERAEPPTFVAVTGKARTFQPDDSDVVYTSVRPENVNEVTAETRDRWNVQAARQTVDRVATMAGALRREERGDELRHALEAEGVDAGLAAGIPLALDHYGTTPRYLEALRTLAAEVAEVVAGERDEVESFTADPDDPGDVDLDSLAGLDVPASTGGAGELPGAGSTAETTAGGSAGTTVEDQSMGESAADEAAQAGTTEPSGAETGGNETASTGETDAAAETGGDDEPSTVDGEPVDAQAGGRTGPDTTETAGDEPTGDVGEFEPSGFDLDEDEREAIEEEYGTDFKSGSEVDEPGEADIETPGPADAPEEESNDDAATAESDTDATVDDADEATDEAAETADADTVSDESGAAETVKTSDDGEPTDADESVDEGESADVDVETAVMDAMREHDEGDGAAESAIVADVTSRLGVDEATVQDALQDALMGGQCYEPEDGVYKPI